MNYNSGYGNNNRGGGSYNNGPRNNNFNQNNRGGRQQQESKSQPIIAEIKKGGTLHQVLTVEKYALPEGWADTIAFELKNDKNNTMGKNTLNSTQLRKIFAEIKQIAMRLENHQQTFEQEKRNVWLLMPNLAYAKNRGVIGTAFYNLMAECIKPEKMKTKEDYLAFAQFMEAIVAYFPKENVR